MDTQNAIRQVAREKVKEMICSGDILLPSDPSAQVTQEVERLSSGKRKMRTLKRWKSAQKILYENVCVFGEIILTNEEGWYSIFERPTGKRLWGKHQADDISTVYQLAIHLSLLTDWKRFPELSEPEQLGIEWCVTEMTWQTGHRMPWELFARMNYDLVRAAEASRNLSHDTL